MYCEPLICTRCDSIITLSGFLESATPQECYNLLKDALDGEIDLFFDYEIHGQWKASNKWLMLYCSKCNFEIGEVLASKYKYCPNCGATMDGEKQ